MHPDFKVHNNQWFFNRRTIPEGLDCKIRFGFDDPKLLDDCPFYAKVGLNTDKSIAHHYIGFAYGTKADVLKLGVWACKFPSRVDLILTLDRNGASTSESTVQKLA